MNPVEAFHRLTESTKLATAAAVRLKNALSRRSPRYLKSRRTR